MSDIDEIYARVHRWVLGLSSAEKKRVAGKAGVGYGTLYCESRGPAWNPTTETFRRLVRVWNEECDGCRQRAVPLHLGRDNPAGCFHDDEKSASPQSDNTNEGYDNLCVDLSGGKA